MKSRLYMCLILALVATVFSACSSAPDESSDPAVSEGAVAQPAGPTAQELFLEGNKALDAREFEGAIAQYELALEQDPERWDIYMNKAIAHSAKQQLSEAVSAIDHALANGGDSEPEVYFNLGNIYQNRGLYGQSIKAYRTSLALRDEPHVDTIMNIAAALMFMRELDQAEETYEHLKGLVPDDPRVYLGFGLIEAMRDNYKTAIEFYDQVIQMDPEFSQAYFNKGVVLNSTEQYSDAIDSFKRYLEIAPDGPYARRAQQRIQVMEQNK